MGGAGNRAHAAEAAHSAACSRSTGQQWRERGTHLLPVEPRAVQALHPDVLSRLKQASACALSPPTHVPHSPTLAPMLLLPTIPGSAGGLGSGGGAGAGREAGAGAGASAVGADGEGGGVEGQGQRGEDGPQAAAADGRLQLGGGCAGRTAGEGLPMTEGAANPSGKRNGADKCLKGQQCWS